MNQARLLIDEDTWPALIGALKKLAPEIDVIRVGDPGAPASKILDPDLLIAAETLGRLLVSKDRSTMPVHLTAHFAAKRHTAGVILLREGFAIGRSAQEIVREWTTTSADDWTDRTIYLP